jgi:hypothetical protein
MRSETLGIEAEALRLSIVGRLYGDARERRGVAVWTDAGSELLLRPDRTSLLLGGGWMMVAIPVETDQTGAQTLRLVYALGTEKEADGLRVASTLDVKDPSGLLSHWGPQLQTAVWAGLLDAVEAAAAGLDKRQAWAAQGISADDKRVNVRFATGGV